LICLIISSDEYKLWSSPLCIFLHYAVTSSLWAPNILLGTLFSNTLSQRPSFVPIQNDWQNYGFLCFNLYVPRRQAGGQRLWIEWYKHMHM
jgi:hypothetical protein